jgi:hypothetical protein
MARRLRIDVEGGLYHLIARGNDRQPARETARDRFREFVMAGIGVDDPEDFSSPSEGSILDSEEFVDNTIHRIGDSPRRRAEHARKQEQLFDTARLVSAVSEVFGI